MKSQLIVRRRTLAMRGESLIETGVPALIFMLALITGFWGSSSFRWETLEAREAYELTVFHSKLP